MYAHIIASLNLPALGVARRESHGDLMATGLRQEKGLRAGVAPAASVVGQTSPSRQTGDRHLAIARWRVKISTSGWRDGETPKAVRLCTATDYDDNRREPDNKTLYQPLWG